MPNEFVAKKGLISNSNIKVTGSLIATSGVTASLNGTSSWAFNSNTASLATSSSYTLSASYAPGSPSVSASYSTSASYAQVICGVNFSADGGSTNISTGSKGNIFIPFNATITGWSLVTKQTGSVVLDVKKSTFDTYPSFTSLTNNTYITSSNQVRVSGSTNTWTSSLSNGDMLQFYVSSSNVTALNLVIYGVKYG